MRKKWTIISIIILVVLMNIPIGSTVNFESPTNKYSVYGRTYLWDYFLKIGNSNESISAKVYLIKNSNNTVIYKTRVNDITVIKSIEWGNNKVYFNQNDSPNSLEPWILPTE